MRHVSWLEAGFAGPEASKASSVQDEKEGGSRGETSFPPRVWLRCARGGTGTRPECELRAPERLLAPPSARPRVEGQGGDPREPRPAYALGDDELHAPERDPPEDVRPGAARRDATDLAAGAVRPRRLAMRVLRLEQQPLDARSRRPALARRHVRLGERRDVLRAVQPPQGRPVARRDEHAATDDPATTHACALHPPHGRAHPGRLADVPPRPRSRSGVALSDAGVRFLA
jgi:hypothetical protein